jgi:hypothetical protein
VAPDNRVEMICSRCGDVIQTSRGPYRYMESGLANVMLLDLEVRACHACDSHELVIPRLAELHQLIAGTVGAEPSKRISLLMYSFRFDAEQTMWLWSVDRRDPCPLPSLPS